MKVDLRGRRLGPSVTRIFVPIAMILILSHAVFGHARLVQSQPKANESLTTLPQVIELWFSEPLESGLNTIEVTDESRKRVDNGDVRLAEDNKKATVNLFQLAPGRYTVRWRALSADQHPMRGTFTFTIAQSAVATAPASSPAQTVTPSPMPHAEMPGSTSGDIISWSQTLVRWLSYAGMLVLFGGFAFRLLVLIPALRNASGATENQLLIIGSKRILACNWIGAILLLVTSILALILQASDVFDTSFGAAVSPARLAEVLRTGYGPSWLLQVGALLALISILLMLSRGVKRNTRDGGPSFWWWLGFLIVALLLVAPTWTGHARLAVEHFRLAIIIDWLHLVAGGFWVGSLFHFALTLTPIFSAAPQHQRVPILHNLIKSFTRVAVPSVALLVLAGSYNTWAHIPQPSALWLTPYGRTLALKLFLVLLMLSLGAVNNYYYGKRASRLANEQHADSSSPQLERSFLRSLRSEAALGIIVLMVTAVLVFLTPARNHPAMNEGAATAKRR